METKSKVMKDKEYGFMIDGTVYKAEKCSNIDDRCEICDLKKKCGQIYFFTPCHIMEKILDLNPEEIYFKKKDMTDEEDIGMELRDAMLPHLMNGDLEIS